MQPGIETSPARSAPESRDFSMRSFAACQTTRKTLYGPSSPASTGRQRRAIARLRGGRYQLRRHSSALLALITKPGREKWDSFSPVQYCRGGIFVRHDAGLPRRANASPKTITSALTQVLIWPSADLSSRYLMGTRSNVCLPPSTPRLKHSASCAADHWVVRPLATDTDLREWRAWGYGLGRGLLLVRLRLKKESRYEMLKARGRSGDQTLGAMSTRP